MSFRGHLRPGQGFKSFTVLKRCGGTTEKGRPHTKGLCEEGCFYGIISQASEKEIEQAKQNGHVITHTIVQRGNQNNAVETDVLELPGSCECNARRFLVQTVRDPGELGHFLIYQVEERNDLG